VWIKLKGEGRVSCESELYDKGKRIIDTKNLSGRRVLYICSEVNIRIFALEW